MPFGQPALPGSAPAGGGAHLAAAAATRQRLPGAPSASSLPAASARLAPVPGGASRGPAGHRMMYGTDVRGLHRCGVSSLRDPAAGPRRGCGPAGPGPQHFPVGRRGSSGRRCGANRLVFDVLDFGAYLLLSPAAAPRRCLRQGRHASGARPNVARSAGATGMAGAPGAERLLRLYVVIAFAAAPRSLRASG